MSRLKKKGGSARPRQYGPPRADGRGFRDIRVDEEMVCPVDPARLPPDAKFAGYEDVVVQDLHIQSHNIRYRLEIWHSPSQGRLRGELPSGVTGEYGPELKALLVSLKYVAGTSLPRAHEFVEHCGVVISPATVSNIVRDAAELFHAEKEEDFPGGAGGDDLPAHRRHLGPGGRRVLAHAHRLQSVSLHLFHDTAQRPTDDRGPAAGRAADVPIQQPDTAVTGGVPGAAEVAAVRSRGRRRTAI